MAFFAVGLYSGACHVFKLTSIFDSKDSDSNKIQIEPLFSTDSHGGSVKSLVISKRYLACSNYDESLHIFDIETRKELGTLIKINLTVDMTFLSEKYLVTLSDNGILRIWDTKDWHELNQISTHRVGIAITSFYKCPIVLTVGGDKKLNVWNMRHGTGISSTVLPEIPKKILFSKRDKRYCVVNDKSIQIFDLKPKRKLNIESSSSIISVDFLDNDQVIYSGESSSVFVKDLKTEETFKWDIGFKRTRDLTVIDVPDFGCVILTIHSEGDIILWDANQLNSSKIPSKITHFPVNGRPVVCSSYSSLFP